MADHLLTVRIEPHSGRGPAVQGALESEIVTSLDRLMYGLAWLEPRHRPGT